MRWIAGVLVAGLVVHGCAQVQEFRTPDARDAGDEVPAAPAYSPPSCGAPEDPLNCGTCGHSCLAGACRAGRCQPIVLASAQGNSAYGVDFSPYETDMGEPLDGPDRLAVDEGYVYWVNLRGEVKRVAIAGGGAETIAGTKPGPAWIALDDQFVYFSTLGAEIFRVAKAGGVPTQLASAPLARKGITLFSGAYPTEFTLSSDQLYWADGTGVYACPKTGCSGPPLAMDQGTSEWRPFSFAIDPSGEMFASGEIHRSTGDASEVIDYAMNVFRDGHWRALGSSIAYYELHGNGGGEVYALAKTDFGPTGVVRWSEAPSSRWGEGASVRFLASGDAVPGAPRGLALDETFVYWSNAAIGNQHTASVVRCKKTGCSAPELLADGQITPRAVAVSNEAVYWTTGDGNVMKLAKPSDPKSAAIP